MKKTRISVCIPAYNEEKNVANLINHILLQKLNTFTIEEIIIISSGSSDNTNNIIRELSVKDKRIKIIIEQERQGKSDAINKLLKEAKYEVIVLESADTLPDKYAIEELCLPLLDENVGMVASHPIPLNSKNNFIDFASVLLWHLHHLISQKSPKFGELIAFRNVISKLPLTAVDEEQLAYFFKNKGYLLKYAPQAICYNQGPKTISEFLIQRRRIFAGHLELKKMTGYSVSTLSGIRISKFLCANLPKKHIFWVFTTVLLEIYARFLGFLDFLTKKNHTKWIIARSTKELNLQGLDFYVGFDC